MKKPARRMFRIGAAVTASLFLGLAATAFASNKGGNAEGIELVNPGTLTVCTHLPYKPFEFINKEGNVVGFDVALTKLLAKDLGVKEKVISIDWNQITSGAVFAARKCDLAMGGETITAKRAEAVLFSDPYFSATQVLLVKKGSGISGLADLKGKRLGVQTDTTGQAYAEKFADKYGYTNVVYADLALETAAVSAGSVAAAINDNGPMYKYVKSNPGTEVAAEFDTGEHYGFAAKKDDANAKKLIGRLNDVLAKAKKDGEYDRIFKKWFGQTPGVTDK